MTSRSPAHAGEPRVLIPPQLDPGAFVARDPGAPVHDLGGATMGTRWSVRIAARALPPGIADAVQAALDAVVAEMSGWEAGSHLSRFNRAPAGSWHALPPGFFHVLSAGLDLAAETGGAFDPAAGALIELWGFGPGPARLKPPSGAEIAAARGDWRSVALDRPGRRALQPGGVVLDLSGIAKGHAVDRIAALLRARGLGHFLVEVGGELKGEGVRPDGQPWWVEIEPPPDAALPVTRVALHGLAAATSGDYRRWFEHDGRRYAHTLDPRTGAPVDNGIASVTVLHSDCMIADALATALTVLGPAEGPAYAEANGIAALFVKRERNGFVETLSPTLAAMAG